MAVHIVRLGTPRGPAEGLRLGTVRRPPRGVRKEDYASRDYYDVWFPNLAPSAALLKWAQAQGIEKVWKEFSARYRAEMRAPEFSHIITLLAALSHQTAFAVGCYCADERYCHRSVLRALLLEHGANVAGPASA